MTLSQWLTELFIRYDMLTMQQTMQQANVNAWGDETAFGLILTSWMDTLLTAQRMCRLSIIYVQPLHAHANFYSGKYPM